MLTQFDFKNIALDDIQILNETIREVARSCKAFFSNRDNQSLCESFFILSRLYIKKSILIDANVHEKLTLFLKGASLYYFAKTLMDDYLLEVTICSEEDFFNEAVEQIYLLSKFQVAEKQQFYTEKNTIINQFFNQRVLRNQQFSSINNDQIQAFYEDNHQIYKTLLSKIINSIQANIGDSPCSYSLIGVGSFAHNASTLQSDLELFIVLSDINPEIERYFNCLLALLHLVVLSFKETPIREMHIAELGFLTNQYFDKIHDGVRIDPFNSPLGIYQHHQLHPFFTLDELKRYLNVSSTANPNVNFLKEILSRHALICGSIDLYDQLCCWQQENHHFAPREIIIKFIRDMNDIPVLKPEMEIKRDYYKPFRQCLSNLAKRCQLRANLTLVEIINALCAKGIVNGKVAKQLTEAYHHILYLRQVIYAKHQAQDDRCQFPSVTSDAKYPYIHVKKALIIYQSIMYLLRLYSELSTDSLACANLKISRETDTLLDILGFVSNRLRGNHYLLHSNAVVEEYLPFIKTTLDTLDVDTLKNNHSLLTFHLYTMNYLISYLLSIKDETALMYYDIVCKKLFLLSGRNDGGLAVIAQSNEDECKELLTCSLDMDFPTALARFFYLSGRIYLYDEKMVNADQSLVFFKLALFIRRVVENNGYLYSDKLNNERLDTTLFIRNGLITHYETSFETSKLKEAINLLIPMVTDNTFDDTFNRIECLNRLANLYIRLAIIVKDNNLAYLKQGINCFISLCQTLSHHEEKITRVSKYIITLAMIYHCLNNNQSSLFYCELALSCDQSLNLENTYTSKIASVLQSKTDLESSFTKEEKGSYAYKYCQFFYQASFKPEETMELHEEFSKNNIELMLKTDSILSN